MKARPREWMLGGLVLTLTPGTLAATLTVGAGAPYATIDDAMADAQPGDVVEVLGDQTYPGTVSFGSELGGARDNPITVRGVPVNGKRPILQGVGPGQWDTMVVLLNASHFILEGFEVVGSADTDQQCIVHKADDVVVRDVVVHGCAGQGLLGTDSESGSLTLEYSEFYGNGNGMYGHQVYMATDQSVYPGSVFRMQHCYLHDGSGGNNVKSRAERNEIYYNWIEGALYHELDLIGPASGALGAPREDSDVVGNVLIKSSEWRIARIGGDGTGNTQGRYRFAYNTMVLGPDSSVAIGLQETVEVLELFDNVVYAPSTSGFVLYNVAEQIGAAATFYGANNWLTTGIGSIPASLSGTLTGNSPSFVNQSGWDLRPGAGSPLIDAGTATASASGSLGVPAALLAPGYHPPSRRLLAPGAAEARMMAGPPDIGAFEANSSGIVAPLGGSGGVSAGGSGATLRGGSNPVSGGTTTVPSGGSGPAASGGVANPSGGVSAAVGGTASRGGSATVTSGGNPGTGGMATSAGASAAGAGRGGSAAAAVSAGAAGRSSPAVPQGPLVVAGSSGKASNSARSGDDGGCGCRVAPQESRFSRALLAALALATVRRRRARRCDRGVAGAR